MGRPRRICLPDLTYHVCSRFINREFLMKKDNIKELMIQVIRETQKKYIFELNCFQILDNHFHFIIKTKNENDSISKIMLRIKSVFAKRLNKILKKIGPVWNERFRSKIVEYVGDPITYLLRTLWYIAYNSYRKNKVNPRKYKYNSINHYLNKNYTTKLKITLHEIFIDLGKTFLERLENFLVVEKEYKAFRKSNPTEKFVDLYS